MSFEGSTGRVRVVMEGSGSVNNQSMGQSMVDFPAGQARTTNPPQFSAAGGEIFAAHGLRRAANRRQPAGVLTPLTEGVYVDWFTAAPCRLFTPPAAPTTSPLLATSSTSPLLPPAEAVLAAHMTGTPPSAPRLHAANIPVTPASVITRASSALPDSTPRAPSAAPGSAPLSGTGAWQRVRPHL
jgi:hypothetical protein